MLCHGIELNKNGTMLVLTIRTEDCNGNLQSFTTKMLHELNQQK